MGKYKITTYTEHIGKEVKVILLEVENTQVTGGEVYVRRVRNIVLKFTGCDEVMVDKLINEVKEKHGQRVYIRGRN